MRDFFHGWRRKMGVVTLMMACVFMGGWFRSFEPVNDSITLGHNHLLMSTNGFVYWYIFYDGDWADSVSQVSMKTDMKFKWNWEGLGMIASDQAVWQQYIRKYGISYWYFISPLTLLSAVLLLSKSRKSTPEKTVEPIPAGEV